MAWNPFLGLILTAPVSAAIFYTKEFMEELAWSPYHSVKNIWSLALCASFCSHDQNCGMFQHNENYSTCALGSRAAGCFLSHVEQTTAPILSVHRDHDLQLHELTTGVQATTAADDKTHWEVLASSIWKNTHHAYYAIDGIAQPTEYPRLYASNDVNDYPWFRIDLKSKHIIVGGRIVIRSGFKARLAYIEVRAGSDNVDDSTESEMMCQNQLCYMTGNNDRADLSFDCVRPIVGSIVTVQKYKNNTLQNILEFNEIFLTAHCGPLSSLDEQCQYGEQSNVDYCAMREQHRDAPMYLASVSEKQNWILTTGPMKNGYGTLAKLVDGVKGGGSANYFYTPQGGSATHYPYPWVQIDFTVQKVVKGVHIYGRTDTLKGIQIRYVEVRVGNVDAAASTPIGQRMCANALCKTTGTGLTANQLDDCSGGPISGRYVTIQRYSVYPPINYPALVMTEIDVKFYHA